MNNRQEILDFIKKFKWHAPEVLDNLFLHGNCYYFAVILKERFPNAIIMYLMIENHFLAYINGYLYDIRGDVTDIVDNKEMIAWDDLVYYDSALYKRIVRDCIKFR